MLFFVHKYFPSFKCKKTYSETVHEPQAVQPYTQVKNITPSGFPYWIIYNIEITVERQINMYFISSWFKQNVWLKQYLTFKATSLLRSNASTTTKGRVRHLIHVSNDLLSDFTAVFTPGKAIQWTHHLKSPINSVTKRKCLIPYNSWESNNTA